MPEFRRRLPTSLFFDWMHCVCASGGVAQYQVNQVTRAILATGLTVTVGSKPPSQASAVARDRTARKPSPCGCASALEFATTGFCLIVRLMTWTSSIVL